MLESASRGGGVCSGRGEGGVSAPGGVWSQGGCLLGGGGCLLWGGSAPRGGGGGIRACTEADPTL